MRAAIRPGQTRLVWVETPTNPLLGIADIAALAARRPRGRRAARRRQHLRLAVPPAAARPRRRRRRALDDQVRRRPLRRRRRRRRRRPVPRPATAIGQRADRVPPERDGRGGRAVRRLAGAARPEDPRGADGPALRQRRAGRRVPRRPPDGVTAGATTRACPTTPATTSPPADEAVRRHGRRSGSPAARSGASRSAAETEVFTLGESLGGVESLIEHPGRMTHASVAGTELEVPARPDPAVGRHRGRRRPRRRPRARRSTGSPDRGAAVPAVPSVLCVDFGSTFTKAVLVDLATGDVLGTASHPTTIATDVLDGVDAVRAALAAHGGAGRGARLLQRRRRAADRRGRLRARGDRRGRAPGRPVRRGQGRARRVRPDDRRRRRGAAGGIAPTSCCSSGGTDGGNAEVLLHNAERHRQGAAVAHRSSSPATPRRADEVAALLASTGRRHVVTDNVLPAHRGPRARGGARPRSARCSSPTSSAARASPAAAGSPSWCAAPRRTPCSRGVEVLADVVGGDVLVVDVGGATTDVYSVITPQGEDATIHREVVGTLWHARTVEGDLGMRWTAEGVVEAGERERIAVVRQHDQVCRGRRRRHGPPRVDSARSGRPRRRSPRPPRWSRCVATAGPPHPSERPRPLADVALVVGSGGVLRHAPGDVGDRVLARVTDDHGGGWRVPDHAAPARRLRLRALRGGAARGRVPGRRGSPGRPRRRRRRRLISPECGVVACSHFRTRGGAGRLRWGDEQRLAVGRRSSSPTAPTSTPRRWGCPRGRPWPPSRVAQDEWRRGIAHAPGYDADVAAAREAYARLVGVPPDTVAIGSQVSPLVGAWWRRRCPTGRRCSCPRGSSPA